MTGEHRHRALPLIERPFWRICAASLVVAMAATGARADFLISARPTANVTCASGVCTATAANAVLNTAALRSMLASGNVTVTTGSVADRLVVHSPLAWIGKSTLSLVAQQQIAIEALTTVRGFGGLSLTTGDGTELGDLAYTAPGRVQFKHPLSKLTINGLRYKLVTNIAELAAAAAANPNARIALADDYDAKPDGIYSSAAPVPVFNGLFEGLGNTISNLTIATTSSAGGDNIGLFGSVGKGCTRCGRLNGIVLTGVSIGGYGNFHGGLVGTLDAVVSESSVKGLVKSGGESKVGGLIGSTTQNALVVQSHADVRVPITIGIIAGGLIGDNQGTIHASYAQGNVSANKGSSVGGLVGQNEGKITASFATGAVNTHSHHSPLGGLVGKNSGVIQNCYATGAVSSIIVAPPGRTPSDVGGLVGESDTAIAMSYSSGAVTGAAHDTTGGFVGYDGSGGGMKRDYWNLDSSGITSPSAGAGNIANDPGITGRTLSQIRVQMPAGFSPTVWARAPNINGGLPYLIANPPPS